MRLYVGICQGVGIAFVYVVMNASPARRGKEGAKKSGGEAEREGEPPRADGEPDSSSVASQYLFVASI
jgi:hypothetical protein